MHYHHGLIARVVTWHGHTARYTADELQLMRDLRAAGAHEDELRTIHELKAVFGAKYVNTLKTTRERRHAA